MKRADLVRHLEENGCLLLREGARHSLFVNPAADRKSTVPRHREINDDLCRKICRDLEIPEIGGRLHEPEANYDNALTASGISTAPATPCNPIPSEA